MLVIDTTDGITSLTTLATLLLELLEPLDDVSLFALVVPDVVSIRSAVEGYNLSFATDTPTKQAPATIPNTAADATNLAAFLPIPFLLFLLPFFLCLRLLSGSGGIFP